MMKVLNNGVKEISKELTPNVNLKLKNINTKSNTFDAVMKKNASNSENMKSGQLNECRKSTEENDIKNDESLNEEEMNYLSQLLGVGKKELKLIMDKLYAEEGNINIDSPKIDLFMVVREKLGKEFNEDAFKILDSLKKTTNFDVFSLEDYRTISKEDILNIMKVIAEFKDDSLVHKNDITKGINKYNFINEGVDRVIQDGKSVQDNLINSTDKLMGNYSKEANSNDDIFLKNLLKTDDNSKFGVDETKVNLLIDKFSDMSKVNETKDLMKSVTSLNINKDNLDVGIVKSIKLMDLSNMKELTLKVVPKELGEMVIKVTLENGILKANIKPTTKEGYELLQNNLNTIKEKLENSSVRIQEFSVDVYEQNTTASNDKNFKENNPRENHGNKLHYNSKDEQNTNQQGSINTESSNDMINMLA